MPRLMFTDEHWTKLKPLLLQQRIYGKANLRMAVEVFFTECPPVARGEICPTTSALKYGL